MNKLILIIAIVFSGMLMQAQDVLEAKLSKVLIEHKYKANERHTYLYDDTGLLERIVIRDDICPGEYAVDVNYYGNCEVNLEKFYWQEDEIIRYEHNGTEVQPYYTDGWDTLYYPIYYLDSKQRVISHDSLDTEWIDNSINNICDVNGDTVYAADEYTDYYNPFNYQNRCFRRATAFDYACGSKYMPKKEIIGSDTKIEVEYFVLSADGDYPTIIHAYEDGILMRKYEFIYESIIYVGTQEISTEPNTVISVEYFDKYGRKIEKPKKGFYIERKLTNKGMISKKYYIN